MTVELTQFLHTRLEEDEAAAQAATAGPWSRMGRRVLDPTPPSDRLGIGMAVGHAAADADFNETADHIARHNPARVLAEVEAKRRALDHYQAVRNHAKNDRAYVLAEGAVAKQIQIMAVPYADHPDYREEWRP